MFGNKILDFKDELLKDLNTLLSFESVDGEKNDQDLRLREPVP